MITNQKTGLDWSRPVFCGLSENLETLGLLTGPVKDWTGLDLKSGLFQSSPVQLQLNFQSNGLDLKTLLSENFLDVIEVRNVEHEGDKRGGATV